MDMPLIEQVRSFNRTMTERVGVLNDHFLGRNHPLGEARLLWEIGEEGTRVRELRRRLGLDSAYVSRLLRSLEKQGLVVVRTSENDGRVRQVQLTEAGLRERAELDQRADAFAYSLLEPLSESQRAKLGAAMAQVERLLIASMVQITVVDAASQ
nr:MarR family transcriptional regulator [Ktedonobacteraceae bacterium]